MINDLIKLANRLDNKGFSKLADELDNIILKLSNTQSDEEYEKYIRPALEEHLRKLDEQRSRPKNEDKAVDS